MLTTAPPPRSDAYAPPSAATGDLGRWARARVRRGGCACCGVSSAAAAPVKLGRMCRRRVTECLRGPTARSAPWRWERARRSSDPIGRTGSLHRASWKSIKADESSTPIASIATNFSKNRPSPLHDQRTPFLGTHRHAPMTDPAAETVEAVCRVRGFLPDRGRS